MASIEEGITVPSVLDFTGSAEIGSYRLDNAAFMSSSAPILMPPTFISDDLNQVCVPYEHVEIDIDDGLNSVTRPIANFSWGFHEGLAWTAGAIYGLAGSALDITLVPLGDTLGLDGDFGYNGVDVYPGVFEAADAAVGYVPAYMALYGAEDPGSQGLMDDVARVGGNVTAAVVTGGAAYKTTLQAGRVGYTSLSLTQQVAVPASVGVLSVESADLIRSAPGIAVAGYELSSILYDRITSPDSPEVAGPNAMDNVQLVFTGEGQIYDQISRGIIDDRVASGQPVSFAGSSGAPVDTYFTAQCISNFASAVAGDVGLDMTAVHDAERRQEVVTSFAAVMDEYGDEELLHCGVIRPEDRAAITAQFVGDTGAVLNHLATIAPPQQPAISEPPAVNAAFSQ